MDKAALIVALVKLLEDLTPEAVALIKALAADLSGVSADQLYDEAATRFQGIIAAANAAKSGAAPSAT